MPTPKPKPVKAPFQQQQQQTNTYGTQSIADTPEAKALLDVPLDFDVDPGVGRRTDLAEQEAENRANSAFSGGVPSFFREQALAKEKRGIRAQGAYEAQQAEYMRKQARTQAELERRRLLLPSIVQTGGSGSSSGYGTQVVQPQGGFLQAFGQGFGSGLGSGLGQSI